MKKSEMYKMAQIAVMNTMTVPSVERLAILRVLMEDENVARYVEEREEEKSEEQK